MFGKQGRSAIDSPPLGSDHLPARCGRVGSREHHSRHLRGFRAGSTRERTGQRSSRRLSGLSHLGDTRTPDSYCQQSSGERASGGLSTKTEHAWNAPGVPSGVRLEVTRNAPPPRRHSRGISSHADSTGVILPLLQRSPPVAFLKGTRSSRENPDRRIPPTGDRLPSPGRKGGGRWAERRVPWAAHAPLSSSPWSVIQLPDSPPGRECACAVAGSLHLHFPSPCPPAGAPGLAGPCSPAPAPVGFVSTGCRHPGCSLRATLGTSLRSLGAKGTLGVAGGLGADPPCPRPNLRGSFP